MKTKTLLLSLTTALTISAAAAPAASALETEFIATGTVSSGYDFNGLFGSVGSDLTGISFTATYYIDTSKGYLLTYPGIYERAYGGTEDNGTQSPVYAVLTINGLSQSFSGSGSLYPGGLGNGEVDLAGGQSTSGGIGIVDGQGEQFLNMYITGPNAEEFPYAFGQAFSVSANGGSGNVGLGDSQIVDLSTNGVDVVNLTFNLISSPGIVNFTSSAPEPSTWALMIAGVGMIGAALRLGRRRGALATA